MNTFDSETRSGRATQHHRATTEASSSPVCLVLTNHPTTGWRYQVDEARKIIGRAKAVDLPVPKQFQSVSRRHAEIWRDRRGCWIRDLGSRMGTRVNLVWIDHLAAASLVPGDLVRLGADLEIQVVSGTPAEARDDELIFDECSGADSPSGATALSPQPATGRAMLCERITPAETEVLLWISRGFLDNDELGRRLHRSPHTVRTQVNSILQKLALHNRGDIVGWLRRQETCQQLPAPGSRR